MMSLIAQLVTTYLALVLATLAAYAIFLLTTQATIDADIQKLGGEIKQDVADAHVLDAPVLYADIFLLQEYRKEHPGDSDLALLSRIASELSFAALPFPEGEAQSFPSAEAMLTLAAKGNMPGPIRGRLAVWTIRESFGALVGRRGDLGVSAFVLGQQVRTNFGSAKLLFPEGPLAVDPWLDRASLATGAVSAVLFPFQRPVLVADLDKYVKGAEMRRAISAYDFKTWWDRAESLRQTVVSRSTQLVTLASLRNAFAIETRLRSMKWIALLGGLLLLLGIVVPLWVMGLRLEDAMPPPANLGLTMAVLSVSVGLGWLVGSDITARPSTSAVRHLEPLLEQIRAFRQTGRSNVTLSLELVNEALADQSRDGLTRGERIVVHRLQVAILKSNEASDKVVELLSEAFRQDSLLQAHNKPGIGGTSLSPLALIEHGTGDSVAGIKSAGSVSIEATRGHVSSTLLALRLPSDETSRERIWHELDTVAESARRRPECGAYLSARVELDRELEQCQGWLEHRIKP
jgi:hypothetical protein